MSEENQINSFAKKREEVPAVQKTSMAPKWSTLKLLSVDLSAIMVNVIESSKIPDTHQNEDLAYISNAIEHARKAKVFDLTGQSELSIFHYQKACTIIDQLFVTRKDKYEDYQILLAPFYFKIGDALATYVELNLDEMNQLKPLELPDDPDDTDQGQDVIEELDEEQEQSPEKKDQNNNLDEEPQIQDYIDKKNETRQ